MNDAPDEPRRAFDDSRRLTGPNRYYADTAVVLTPLGAHAGDAAAHARWAEGVRRIAAALGWPDPQPFVHRHALGVTLACAAPEGGLFTATEINEWAWEQAAGDLPAQGLEPLYGGLADAAAEFRRRARAEFSPPLARLQAAARARGLPDVADDDTWSVGAGSGSAAWPRAALPLALDVPWPRLHDVPTVLVTGSNGKTTTARLVAAMAAAAGHVAGLSSTEGVTVGVGVGSTQVASGDYAGPAGARLVLRHPAVQFAVLETARGGLLRRGLALRRAAAAVVTNVSADHLGEYGIDGLDDIATAKLIVAHAVRDGGTLVLNGADAALMQAARRLPHAAAARQALFALDFEHPELRAQRARGGAVCGVHHGVLTLEMNGIRHALGALAELPLALEGAAPHNLENLAAAALAAAAAGVPAPVLAAVATQFGRHPQDNPGRLERHAHRGASVLIDYAHNPDGLAQLLRVARSLKPRRLLLLLGQAGNRDDAAIAELARTAAAAAPDYVLLKELPQMLRGRAAGEVPALLRAALLAAGQAPASIGHEDDEASAAQRLLQEAAPGDVVVLPLHTTAARQQVAAALQSTAGCK